MIRNREEEISTHQVADVRKANKKALGSGILKSVQGSGFIEPTLHINVIKGGYYSIFDKVHQIDKHYQDIVISKDTPPLSQKMKKSKMEQN